MSENSLFYYGRPYHLVFDPLNSALRRQVLGRVPEKAYVLDVACGTGELAIALRAEKNCRVLGIDLSERMLALARKRNPYDDVRFELRDAVEGLQGLEEGSFGVAVVSQFLHEITADARLDVLRGVTRVAATTFLLDYLPPLRRWGPGLIPRIIEASVGRSHRDNFLAYLASGGIPGLVDKAGLQANIRERAVYASGTGELLVLNRYPESSPPIPG